MSDKLLLVKTILTGSQNQLSKNQFIRVHRSYLVNINVISAHSYDDTEIGTIEISIGNSYKQKCLNICNRISYE